MRREEVTVVARESMHGVDSWNNVITACYITFETFSKQRLMFSIPTVIEYMGILAGDKGILVFDEGKTLFGKSNGEQVFHSFERHLD